MQHTQEIHRLASLDTRPHTTVSLYLGLDQSRDGRLSKLGQLLKDAEQNLGGNGNAGRWESLRPDLERATRMVEELPLGPERGLAIFSCAAQGVNEVFTLPLVVPNLLEVGPVPYIRPLAALAGDHGQTVAVLVDKRRVRFFEGFLGMLGEREDMELDAEPMDTERDGDRGRGGDARLGRRVEEITSRLYKEAAAALLDMCQTGKCQQVVIGGVRGAAEQFKEYLHPYLLDRLGGVFNMEADATALDVQREVARVQSDERRLRQDKMLDSLREGMGPGGKVATGLNQVLAALYEGQVHTLFLRRGYKPAGGSCPSCGRLRHMAGDCPLCGQRMTPVADVANLAVASALSQGARLEQIEGASPLDELGGMAALLRYA